MARFKEELPTDLIKEFEKLGNNAEKMMKEMTQAGAKVVYSNINNNMPSAIKNSNISKKLKITRAYNTKSDDGINTKVAFYGDYYTNSKGKKVPLDLILKVFEFGRKDNTIPKTSFVRKSFNKSQIENAMKQVEEKYLPKE